MGINALKALRIGRALIETNTKRELKNILKDINDNWGKSLETQTNKLRNTSLVILDIPDKISTSNIEEIIIAQNPELDWVNGDIYTIFIYVTKTH